MIERFTFPFTPWSRTSSGLSGNDADVSLWWIDESRLEDFADGYLRSAPGWCMYMRAALPTEFTFLSVRFKRAVGIEYGAFPWMAGARTAWNVGPLLRDGGYGVLLNPIELPDLVALEQMLPRLVALTDAAWGRIPLSQRDWLFDLASTDLVPTTQGAVAAFEKSRRTARTRRH